VRHFGPKIHLVIVAVYIALVPVSYVEGWLSSVTFVSGLSIWALVESRLGTYKAAEAANALAQDANVSEVIEKLDEKLG